MGGGTRPRPSTHRRCRPYKGHILIPTCDPFRVGIPDGGESRARARLSLNLSPAGRWLSFQIGSQHNSLWMY